MLQAITGEAIAMRCERIRNSMRRSLFLIQNMIPSMLANQASLLNSTDHTLQTKFFYIAHY